MTIEWQDAFKMTDLRTQVRRSVNSTIDPVAPRQSALDLFKLEIFECMIVKEYAHTQSGHFFIGDADIFSVGVSFAFQQNQVLDRKLNQMNAIFEHYPEITETAFAQYHHNIEKSPALKAVMDASDSDFQMVDAKKAQRKQLDMIAHGLSCTMDFNQPRFKDNDFSALAPEKKTIIRNSFLGRML